MSLHISLLLVLCTSFAFAAEIKNGIRLDAPKGGNFEYNIGGEPPILNPITSADVYATNVHTYTGDSLTFLDPNTYDYKPRLAEKWEISKDNKVFTFFLRKNAVFHDGKPITAEDVKFSFESVFDSRFDTAHRRPYYEGIEKVEVVDTHTVKFTAKDAYFLNFDVCATMEISPKHIYNDPENHKKLNKSVVGAGPYKFESYDKGTKIVVKKFDKWYGNSLDIYKGAYNYDAITFRFLKDQNIQIESLKKGNIDYVELSAEMYLKKTSGPMWGKDVVKYKIDNAAPQSYGFIGWNFKNKLFQDKKVRKALTHLMNRTEMNKKFRDGMSDLATGPTYVKSDYASPKVKPILFDIKKAGELLAQAGWKDSNKNGTLDKDGQEFKFTLMHANQDNEKYWTWYKEDLKKAGIDMELKYMEWNSFTKALDDSKFDAIAMGWGASSIHWDPKQIWHSASVGGGSNYIGYKNSEVDKLIDEARYTVDKKARMAKLHKVYEMVADDAPYIFMFNNKYTFYATTARVKKAADNLKYVFGMDYWWLEK